MVTIFSWSFHLQQSDVGYSQHNQRWAIVMSITVLCGYRVVKNWSCCCLSADEISSTNKWISILLFFSRQTWEKYSWTDSLLAWDLRCGIQKSSIPYSPHFHTYRRQQARSWGTGILPVVISASSCLMSERETEGNLWNHLDLTHRLFQRHLHSHCWSNLLFCGSVRCVLAPRKPDSNNSKKIRVNIKYIL